MKWSWTPTDHFMQAEVPFLPGANDNARDHRGKPAKPRSCLRPCWCCGGSVRSWRVVFPSCSSLAGPLSVHLLVGSTAMHKAVEDYGTTVPRFVGTGA